jgi:hypothetical protein
MRLATDTAREQLLAFVSAIFALPTAEEIADQLREFVPPSPFRVRMKVVYSPLSVLDAVGAMATAGLVQRLRKHGPGFLFQAVQGSKIDTPVYFAVLPTKQPHVSVLVTVAERVEWQILVRAIRKEYPVLVPIYLSQGELLTGIVALGKRIRGTYELRVRELSLTETLSAPEGKKNKTVHEWTSEDLQRSMESIADRRQVIQNISVAFHRQVSDKINVVPSAVCKVTKRGEIEFTGRYDVIWTTIVDHVAEVGAAKLAFYAKRGLRETDFQPRPLAITYAAPVFSDTAEVRRLVDVLKKYPKSMHAVTHGNPYAFVQVADAYDGSSFDVWAVSPESITVIPRLKATEAAVDRLIHYLFDEFREGRVDNYVVE